VGVGVWGGDGLGYRVGVWVVMVRGFKWRWGYER